MKKGELANNYLSTVFDFVCLLYHEARNIYNLEGRENENNILKYRYLLGIPQNRKIAWKYLFNKKEMALKSKTVEGIQNAFVSDFKVNLSELYDLFDCFDWKGTSCGGKLWANICLKVIDLIKAIVNDEEDKAKQLLDKIPELNHNTGTVKKKIMELKKRF